MSVGKLRAVFGERLGKLDPKRHRPPLHQRFRDFLLDLNDTPALDPLEMAGAAVVALVERDDGAAESTDFALGVAAAYLLAIGRLDRSNAPAALQRARRLLASPRVDFAAVRQAVRDMAT